MIKVIKGSIIYNNGVTTVTKTPKDEPWEASEELEKMWVEEGFAEYAGPSAPKKSEEKDAEEGEDEGDSLEVFTKAQLIEKFNELGLDGNPNKMNKAQLIEAIENAPVDGEAAEDGEAESEEDDAPDLGEEDGVVD